MIWLWAWAFIASCFACVAAARNSHLQKEMRLMETQLVKARLKLACKQHIENEAELPSDQDSIVNSLLREYDRDF